MNKILNFVIQRYSLRTAVIVFASTNIIVIGIELIVGNFLVPLVLNIHLFPLEHFVIIVLDYAYSLCFTILLIFIGTILVHLGFSRKERNGKYLILLRSTLLLSVIGIPFLFFQVPDMQFQGKFSASFIIDYPVTGIITSFLTWLQFFCHGYSLKFSDQTHFIFFGVVFLIYAKVISCVYKTSFKDSLIRLLIASIILAVFWFLFSIIFPGYANYFLRLNIFHSYLKSPIL